MNINISLVTYKHSFDSLRKTIDSILKLKIEFKFVIIDNSPTDKLKNEVLNLPLEYVFNGANIGFGAAHNIAMKNSIQDGAKYHLVINPDIEINEGTIEALFDYMEINTDIGNIMPKVYYPDGSLQYLCKLLPTPYDWIGRRFNPLKSLVERRNRKFELRFTGYSHIMEVPYLSGCFMFLRTSVLKEIGLFDTGIFMYGEETDLCRRIINSGYRTVFYADAFIYHEFQKGSHKSLRLSWIGIKSAVYYFNKWGWFFDKARKRINKRTLKQLGFYN